MPDFNLHLDLRNSDFENEPLSSGFILLFLLAGFTVTLYALARFAESKNRLNYDSRLARIVAGSFMIMMHLLHTKEGDLELGNAKKKIIAIGPHRTSLDAGVVASKMKDTPPSFFATDAYNNVPLISFILSMFKTIPIAANATKNSDGRSANAKALEIASEILNKEGCIALFPQGNFAKIAQKPPKIYEGVAKLALKHKIPIQVIRLDGFWSLQNPFIPLFIRNHSLYRAIFSLFHINNVRVTPCGDLDFHLKAENETLSDEAKIEELCAQLYAFYYHTEDWTPQEIEVIKSKLSDPSKKSHLLFWKNRLKQDDLGKQLSNLEKEATELKNNLFLEPSK